MHFLQTHMFLVIENKVLQEYRERYVVVYMLEGSSQSHCCNHEKLLISGGISRDLFSIYLLLFTPTSSLMLYFSLSHILLLSSLLHFAHNSQRLRDYFLSEKKAPPRNHLQYILLHGFSYMCSMIHTQC